ncbi:MAG TPA: saccharopine dehydrogenase C-terminal domain-containing protein [Fimbriimonas sp.]
MNKTFAVLGAGMQGTAAAYDLAKFADPAHILLGDMSLHQAQKSAERVNSLLDRLVCVPMQVDALDPESLGGWMSKADVLLSCVPYYLHTKVAATAIRSGVDMVDLGGNTPVTMATLEMDAEARQAGVTLVPDTGLAPGLVNSIGAWLIEQLDEAQSVRLYCGVLPQNPIPPFNYKLTFNVEGLVTEYDYEAVVLRDGEIRMVETLDELEEIHIDELGTMEAFTTSGGTSTAPYTFHGRVRDYEYKTIRFPGHCHLMRAYKDFGLWREDEVEVKGVKVRPKDVFCRVFGEELAKIQDLDQCAVRGVGIGLKDGEKVRLQVDVFDRQCPETHFTSMERLTGFSMAIYAASIARGEVPRGCVRYELAMSGARFLEEIQRRGVKVRFSEERLPSVAEIQTDRVSR